MRRLRIDVINNHLNQHSFYQVTLYGERQMVQTDVSHAKSYGSTSSDRKIHIYWDYRKVGSVESKGEAQAILMDLVTLSFVEFWLDFMHTALNIKSGDQ